MMGLTVPDYRVKAHLLVHKTRNTEIEFTAE